MGTHLIAHEQAENEVAEVRVRVLPPKRGLTERQRQLHLKRWEKHTQVGSPQTLVGGGMGLCVCEILHR